MKKELQLHSSQWGKSITSIYFGGGTPSVLSPKEFTELYEEINQNYDLKMIDEVTLECNPEDLIEEKLEAWIKQGVNRLSIGNQSFQDPILKTINRQHNAKMAIDGIMKAREYGFNAISVDVIMGLPGLTMDLLEEDLRTLMDLDPEHISAYQLSVEEKTKLAYQLKKGEIKISSDEEINQQFLMMDTFLNANGYSHYEVSNYAKMGFEAKHNSSYWSGVSYLGIGPGAHSFKDNIRRWNVSNNNLYAKELTKNGKWFEEEVLDEKDRFNERIMISLRIKKGLDLGMLQKDFPLFYTNEIDKNILSWINNDWAVLERGSVQLTLKGWLISDKLASDIFVI